MGYDWNYLSAQALLWRPITQDYWNVLSVMAGLGAVFLFKSMVREAKSKKDAGMPTIDGVMVARLGLLGGMILTGFAPLNSACQAWAVCSFAFSGFWFGLMLEVRWCHRIGSAWEKVRQISGEYGRRVVTLRVFR